MPTKDLWLGNNEYKAQLPTRGKSIRVSVVCIVHHPHQSFVSIDRNVAPQSLTGHTATVRGNAKMKISLTIILSILLFVACRQQPKADSSNSNLESADILNEQHGQKNDSAIEDFSTQWKIDSLGQNGFRMEHYGYEKTTRTWLVNGMSFKGYSKEKIVNIFGQPTDSGLGKEDKLLIMTYIVRQSRTEPDKTLIMYFDKDNKLDDIIEETGMEK